MSARRSAFGTVAMALLALLALLAGCDAGSGAAVLQGTSGPSPTPASVGRLLILGDSFTEGYAAVTPGQGYARRLGDAIGWPYEVDGVGGTGFVYPGLSGTDSSYRSRLQQRINAGGASPTLVILQGGLNDYRAPRSRLTAAVSAEIGLVRAAWPSVRVVLFGPVRAYEHNDDLRPMAAALGLASLDTNVAFVDPVGEGWVTASNSRIYFIADGTHPNSAGHAYIARRLLADLQRLGAVPARTRVA